MAISEIRACASADALEKLVGDLLQQQPLADLAQGGETAASIAEALEAKSNDAALGCNAKLRRKIKRLVTSLQDGTFGASREGTSNDTSAADRPPVVDPAVDPAGAVRAAASFFDLKTTMDSIIVPSDDNLPSRQALKAALEEKLKNPPFAINKLLRRRIDRLIFALSDQSVKTQLVTAKREKASAPVEPASAARPASVIKDKAGSMVEQKREAIVAVDDKEVSRWCSEVQAATNLADLERALGFIVPEQVCSKGQKRLLVQHLVKAAAGGGEGDGGVALNAKARRRIARLIEALGGEAILVNNEAANATTVTSKDDSAAKSAGASIPAVLDPPTPSDPAAESSTAAEPSSKPNSSTVIPYVVFVGQLDYKVQEEDIVRHFRSGGVEGDMKVRMTSDRATGKFKGTAFVELEGPRELHKAIGLHHTLLNGRRINVEKSCGGRNKELRTMRIKEQRTTQKIHASDAVDAVIKKFEETGLFSTREIPDNIMNRLYACTPSEVQTMMDQFNKDSIARNGPGAKGDLREFNKILCAHDKGGYQVDQSKMRGYGDFFPKRARDDGYATGLNDALAADEGGESDDRPSWPAPPSKIARRESGRVASHNQVTHDADGASSGTKIFERFPSMRGRGGKMLR